MADIFVMYGCNSIILKINILFSLSYVAELSTVIIFYLNEVYYSLSYKYSYEICKNV